MKSPNQSKILIFQGIRSQAWVRLNLTQILSNIPKHPLPSPIKLKLFSSSTDKIIAASNLEFRIEQKQLNFMLRSKIISTIMIWVRRTKALRERKRKWVTSKDMQISQVWAFNSGGFQWTIFCIISKTLENIG